MHPFNVSDGRHIDALLSGALPGGALYAVGGRVRDEVRSEVDGIPRPAKDFDYVAVGIGLAELVERLRSVGRADVVGAAFAVVKVTLGGTTVDVALPRRERSTGRGHRDFDVEAGPSVTLEDDLARRDFRMNMLARAIPGGDLVDPYGGRADIEAARIDLLRDEAFDEDPLRMLRACQFAARFSFVIAPRTMEAMRRAAPLVETVSAERIRDELVKFLALAPRPSAGLEWMREGGLLPYVLPEIGLGIGVEQNEWHAFDVYRHTLETLDAAPPGDLVLRLAALFHDAGKPATKQGPHFYGHETVGAEMSLSRLEALRFPAETIQRVAGLVRNHMYSTDPAMSDSAIRRFVRRVGPENLDRQFALRAADIVGSGLPKRNDANERFQARVAALLSERPPLSTRDLAIGGEDVIRELTAAGKLAPGSRGGPLVGKVLAELLDRVIEDPTMNVRHRLLEAVCSVSYGMSSVRTNVSRETRAVGNHEGE